MTGEYRSYEALYEFHKMTSASSWFGLSNKTKYEHVKRLSHEKAVKVTITPIGALLSASESQILVEKMQAQLLYFSVERFLNKDSFVTAPPPLQPGELGASKAGERLMMVPNPYAFWAGLALKSLGEMFGSSTAEQVKDLQDKRDTKISYEAGVTALIPGDITIGDLKRIPLAQEGE